MKELCLKYENGNKFQAYIVRYFRFGNNKYLIYSLKELDERNYEKLYVVKIMKALDMPVTQTVRRPDEWKQMKNIVKHILVEIKNNKLTCIEDLEPLELEGITIYENRSFWIATDLVKILTTNESPIDVTQNKEESELINIEVLNLENSDDQEKTETIDSLEEEELEILEL